MIFWQALTEMGGLFCALMKHGEGTPSATRCSGKRLAFGWVPNKLFGGNVTLALETLVIRPDIFILLDVPDEIIVERVVERQLDPVTGKIYHLKYSPAENEEIASRLTQRFDDTEEKIRLRLQTHYQNVESLLSIYEDVIVKDGQYLRPSDPSYEQVFDSLAMVARHTTLPLLEALLRWRESESPPMMPQHTK